ncbi:MAG: helix-turn-helix domain-containing protein [Gammaproteobacteria bacterium]|nr:helix-turn-helix domain-containing protein [Gammaproteobacteria bacterium]
MSNATEKQTTSAREEVEVTPEDSASEEQLSEGLTQEPDASAEESPEHLVEPPAWERLRQAREQRQLGQADIAAELRLDLSLVNALEEGNFSKLPEAVYTAGYVRAYARLIDLPPDEIVAKYTNAESDHRTNDIAGREEIPARYRQLATALPKSFSVAVSRGDNSMLRYVILLVCLVVVLIILWQWQAANNNSTNNDVTNPTSIDIDAGLEQRTTTPLEVSAPELPTSVSVVDEVSKPKPFSTKSVKLAIPQQGGSLSARVDGSQSDKPLSEQQARSLGTQRSALANMSPQTESISLHFAKDSWIDIRDSTGKRLIRRLGLAGASKTVTGMAPFEVLIGYGPGVKIEYNGQPFDFSKFQSKRVARFTLEGVDKDSGSSLGAEINN